MDKFAKWADRVKYPRPKQKPKKAAKGASDG